MKLQKRFNRKVGDKEYSKWVVTLPPEIVDSVGWKQGDELEVDMKDDKVVIKRKKSR